MKEQVIEAIEVINLLYALGKVGPQCRPELEFIGDFDQLQLV
jgi:hypothetical protein